MLASSRDHCHHPRAVQQPNLLNSCMGLPNAIVALRSSLSSRIVCATACIVPCVRARCASLQIHLYGTTMDGATLQPSSIANTSSLGVHGVLAPQIAVMMTASMLVNSRRAMSANSSPNSAAATIMTDATVALRS